MTSLLPPNATDFERDLEAVLAGRVDSLPVNIKTLWNPDTCPLPLLPWLAWALSVDEWDSNWSEAQKRAAVSASVTLHREKGTVGAVKRIINQIFGGGDVVEHWEFDGAPHTFKIASDGQFQDERDYAQLIRLTNSVKTARSTVVAVELRRSATQSFNRAGCTHTGTTTHVGHTVDPQVDDSSGVIASLAHTGAQINITPAVVAPSFDVSPMVVAGVIQSSHLTTIQAGA